MYTALYRRYRPGTFDEMAGQGHVVKILKNQIKTGSTAHAYLFCGTRGTGKTSAARIFAKGVNCLSQEEKPCGVCENCVSIQNGTFFDVIEIDAASNNGVDNIRELRESVKYPPTAGLCKVYIIDEVHMLSQGAFNALLKTLEEPPSHVIFILATTEPHKLPATILSRCLRLDFRRVPEKEICDKLKEICGDLGLSFEESAISLIASAGDGSVRDSLSILEQCIPVGETSLTRKGVVEVLGTAGEEAFIEITGLIAENKSAEALLLIDRISEEGKDLRQFTRDWTFHLRNLMMSKYAGKLETIMNMSCENAEKVKEQGRVLSQAFISNAISELSKISNQMRWSTQPRTLLELAVVKLSTPALDDNVEFLIQRIERLEQMVEAVGKGKVSEAAAFAAKPEEDRPPWEEPEDLEFGKKDISESVTRKVSKELPKKPELASESKSLENKEPESEIKQEKKTKTTLNKHGSSEAADLWKAAFEKAILSMPSLTMLKGNIIPKELEGTTLVLEAASEVMKRYTEQNQAYLESLLKEHSGKEIRIKILLSGGTPEKPMSPEPNKSMEQTIGKLNALFGSDKLTISD